MKEQYFDIIIPLVIILIAGVFLPKQVIKFTRDLLKFFTKSIIKHWYLVLILVGIFVILNFKYYEFNKFEIAGVLALIIVFIAILNFILILTKHNKNPNLAIYGCYSIKDGEYLIKDIDSKLLDEKASKVIDIICNNHFIFKNNLIEINWIELPDFYSNFLGLRKLNKLISKRAFNKHFASIHFVRNINEQNVIAEINVNKSILINAEHINEELDIINDISQDESINNNKKIEIIIQIYLMIFSQSFNDHLLDNKLYSELHRVLEDSLKLLDIINTHFKELGLSQKQKEFVGFWESSNYRYKSLALLDQDELTGSIEYVFKSISINPYYPFKNYKELKQEYTKIYGVHLAPSIIKAKEMVEIEVNAEEINNSRSLLNDQSKYGSIQFTCNILKDIIKKEETDKIINLIEENFRKLDQENPFILLSQSDTLKYIKKGDETHDDIYIARFEECIVLLEKIKKLDPDFTLIRTKLGIMKFLKGMYDNDEELMENGLKEWQSGAHFIKELGLE